ncbi:sulfatase [Phaeobacter sp. J2-8]|uniref:sulfatase family protein n=1 Tax=Phaeobacter sp. J2-8 TaxID=2931394 RepID=UPI001FD47D9C|nr:sulfatase [Phaeobacter sp. J2-8]MCJ7873429.1 sulfatase [Phaeobacter sp. J2-8]
MSKKPNILMIYADQMRYDCMGCSGNPDVKTPNIDRLAQEGVCFDEAFTSYPLCTPFRASLLTGKYAHEAGLYSNHFPINTDQPSLAPYLNSIGYQSGYIGKWHLFGGPKPGFVPPGPDRMGFDHFVGYNRGHQYMDAIFYRDTDQPYHCKRYEPDFQTDHAIEFMDKVQSESDDPFYAYICFGPPHFPMDMPENWRNMYDPDAITLPKGTPNPELQKRRTQERTLLDFDGDDRFGERSKADKIEGQDREIETEQQIRKFVAEYYGMISNIDFNVGRLLSWLDAKGLAEDTLVIFFSDHGDMLGQHGSYCGLKRQAYRSSAHVPLMVRYPGKVAQNKRVSSLVDVAVDTMPTLLEVCGLEVPKDVQGRSYLSLLRDGPDTATRDHVQYQVMKADFGGRPERHVKPERGIRTPEWLYVRKKDRPLYLFDQINDPDEVFNLVDDPAYATVQAELDARVLANMAETGDGWDLEMDFPPPGYMTHAEAHQHLLTTIKPAAIEVL